MMTSRAIVKSDLLGLVGSCGVRVVTGRAGHANQGPFCCYTLHVRGERVEQVAFKTIDCPWAYGIAMAGAALIEHRPLTACAALQRNQIIAFLGDPVPPGKWEYLDLVCQAAHAAAAAAVTVETLA